MIRIYISSVISAPVDMVWAKVRDFNGLADWHPAVASSTIENGEPSDRVGCVRNFTLHEGGDLRERLLAHSDVDRYHTYSILDSPMPVENYIATLRLREITDGDGTFAEWTAEFDTEAEAEMRELIGNGVFQAGLDAIKNALEG